MNDLLSHAFNQKVSLLVCSCEKSKKLIPPFLELFDANVEFKLQGAITLSDDFCSKKVKLYGIGKAHAADDFSSRILQALKKIDTPYTLLMLDDFFLFQKIRTEIVTSAFSILNIYKNVGYVLLQDKRHESELEKHESGFFSIKKNIPYRISTQAAIWRTSYLHKILRKGESAWDFEDLGSRRSNHYRDIILFVGNYNPPVFPYPVGGILWRGEIEQDVVPFLKSNDYEYLLKCFRVRTRSISVKEDRIRNIESLSKERSRKYKRIVRANHLYLVLSVFLKFLRYPSRWSVWNDKNY